MLRAYKYQIDLNNNQITYFNKSFGCCRFVYNKALALKIDLYEKEKINIQVYDLRNKLTEWKQDENTKWLQEVNSQILQQSIFNLDNAYKNFFKHKKGYPKFKKRSGKQSCKFDQNIHIDFEHHKIKLPKIGWIKYFADKRRFDGLIRSATVSKLPCGKYFVSVLIDTKQEIPDKSKVQAKTTIGIDVGIKHFAVLSDGQKIDNPHHLDKQLQKLKYLQKQLSRKQKGSNRRNVQRLKVAKQHYKIQCQRKDFLHKLSSKIVSENQTIVVEDLNIGGMLKNHNLAKSISDVGWGLFFDMLEYKSEWYGKNFIKIGRFEPSSKKCSNCKEINQKLTLNDRHWICDNCGTKHDRDINAAINIKKIGIATYINNSRSGRPL